MEFDLGRELGSDEGYSSQRITLYIPNKDKDGRELTNVEKWVNGARELLSQIGGGATAYPPADGNWVDEKGGILWEQTRIIFCYVYPDRLLAKATELREFLHRFGRETNQGEVVVEFDDLFWRIKRYDAAQEVDHGKKD
jgi:hypothetical protein